MPTANVSLDINDLVFKPIGFTLTNKEKIKKVIFNDPATIILWSDNTKTVVKWYGNGDK